MYNSLYLPIVTILASGFFLINSLSLPKSDSGLSAGAWPQAILIGMMLLGITLLVRELLAIRKKKQEAAAPEAKEKQPLVFRHWLVLAALIVLTFCVKTVGFPLCILCFILVVGFILKGKPKTLIITAVIATFLISVVFMNLLGISVPDGKGIFRYISRAISLELFM